MQGLGVHWSSRGFPAPAGRWAGRPAGGRAGGSGPACEGQVVATRPPRRLALRRPVPRTRVTGWQPVGSRTRAAAAGAADAPARDASDEPEVLGA